MNHTPTPWKFSGPHTCEIVANVNGLEGYPTIVAKSGGRWDGEAVANGAYIVQCVNAHEALVTALKALLDHSSSTNHAFFVVGKPKALHAAMAGQKAVLDQARAALALAEKGAP